MAKSRQNETRKKHPGNVNQTGPAHHPVPFFRRHSFALLLVSLLFLGGVLFATVMLLNNRLWGNKTGSGEITAGDGGDTTAVEPLIVVAFPDPNLEQLVRLELGIDSGVITSSAMESLEIVHGGRISVKINDLTGLEYAVNLQSAYLAGQQITELSALAELTRLELLDLAANQVSDISPLSKLTQLTHLELSRNRIVDISPVKHLAGLESLDLSANQISDLSPLSDLTKLRYLDLSKNTIEDLSPLQNLANLTVLNLSRNRVSDLSPLAGLKLNRLSLSHNQVRDLTPLIDAAGLEYLDLSSNQLHDITDLAGLTDLGWLKLAWNNVSSLAPLSKITGLTGLDLRGNHVSDVSPLSKHNDLKHLHLCHNRIADIAALPALSGAWEVCLTGNPIKKAGQIEALRKTAANVIVTGRPDTPAEIPFTLDDWYFFVGNQMLDFCTRDADIIVARLGQPAKEAYEYFYYNVWGTVVSLTYPGAEFTITEGHYLVRDKMSLTGTGATGPRQIQPGDTFDSVLRKFPDQAKPLELNTENGGYFRVLYDYYENSEQQRYLGKVYYDENKDPVTIRYAQSYGPLADTIWLIVYFEKRVVSGIELTFDSSS